MELYRISDHGPGRHRICKLSGALGLALIALTLAGCVGGLFPEPVSVVLEPEACGSTKPRYAPYFTASPTRGEAPLAVTFASNGPDVIEWRWSFGDGDASSLPAPVHTYTLAGLYTVELAVVRPLGDGSGGTKVETLSRKLFVQVSGHADLTITSLAHTPDAGTGGTALTFTVTVRNDGNASASSSYVLVRDAKRRNIFAAVPCLAPGASATVAAVVTMSRSLETFTIQADGTSRVHESNEKNNTILHTVSATP
jgi:PKD repeat protein